MNNFGERLRSARVMARLSMDQLVERMGGVVSKQSLSKYERGLMKPGDSSLLIRLSKALDIPVDYFFRDSILSLEGMDFRKKARLPSKELSVIREAVRDQLERYLELETLLGCKSRFVNPLQGVEVASYEDVEKSAEKMRISWGIGILSPIVKVIDLLEENEIRILELEVTGDLDGLSGMIAGVPVIILQRNVPGDRKRFTALHELGHLLLRFGTSFDARQIEKLCHSFAAAILLPRQALIKELGGHDRSAVSIPELVHLKEHYGISIQAAMARINSLGIISYSAYRRFNVFISQHGLRVREPWPCPFEEKSTHFKKLLHRALAEGAISLSKAASLAGISSEKLEQEMVSGG